MAINNVTKIPTLTINDSTLPKEQTSSKLLHLCETLQLFHDENRNAYCRINDGGVNRILKLTEQEFTLWLRRSAFKVDGKAISSHIIAEVVATLEARAIFDGTCEQVAIRNERINNKIYLDLCDDKSQIVEICADGYEIIRGTPVNFLHKRGMLPLPTPIDGGDLALLKKHLGQNMDNDSFILVLAWILGALRGVPPYPILILNGEQGSGKRILSKKIRMLVDPSSTPLSYSCRDERDLSITADASHMLSIDNISSITQCMSDLMCVISTGGSFTLRKLHTDNEQVIFKLANPLLINGISCIPQYPDLLERSILIDLHSIDATTRKTESEIMADFENDYAKMMGCLCNVLAQAINNFPHVKLAEKPRMADFCQFVTAAEGTLSLEHGTFTEAMEANQSELGELAIDGTSFVEAIKLFAGHNKDNKWLGTMSELLTELERHFGRDHMYIRASDWPRNSHQAGKLLARFKPLLKRNGLLINQYRKSDASRLRLIEISVIEK